MEHQLMGPNWTQAEGFILGVGAKMFTIAGPVIVYGVSASVVYSFCGRGYYDLRCGECRRGMGYDHAVLYSSGKTV